MADNLLEDTGFTLKQRTFIKYYLKYGNGTKAALKAYDTKDPHVASVIAAENLVKLREPVKLLMEQKGLSLGRLLDVLDGGLNAHKIAKDGSRAEDFAIRHKYLETAARWLGFDKDQPRNVSFKQNNFFFETSQEERDRFNRKFKEFLSSQYATEN